MAEMNTSASGSGKRSGRKQIPARVDLTAMVDLAFLLITFFMLTTTLREKSTMPIAMPDKHGPETGETSDKRTLTLCLGKDNKIVSYLGLIEKPIIAPQVMGYGGAGIRKALVDAQEYVRKTTGKTMMVLLKPSDNSIYDNLVTALDELEITRVPSYAIVDISGKDIDLLKSKGIY